MPPVALTVILPPVQVGVALREAVSGVLIIMEDAVPHLGAILDGSSGHCLAVPSEASVQARKRPVSAKDSPQIYVIVGRDPPVVVPAVKDVVASAGTGPTQPVMSDVVTTPVLDVRVRVPKKANEVRTEPVLL